MHLKEIEGRVLGALMEKAATTPEHYPLSTQALVTACNQRQNRDPVTDLDESTVLDAVSSLREEHLVRSVKRPGDRVMKHREDASQRLKIDPEEFALLAVLLLRGAQTAGELRVRTERYVAFETLEGVEAALGRMADRETPLCHRLERRPGHKEARWESTLMESAEGRLTDEAPPTPAGESTSLQERVAALETAMEAISEALARLQAELGG